MIVNKAIDFISIRSSAHSIANHAHAAYYIEGMGSEASVAHQEMHLMNEFREIAKILGYRLEKIKADTAERAVDAQAAE